ncbi:MAG: hypothetical protein RLZZ15_2796 [Verrucomicrobiota bacterium]|jgi:hypothetical protein
MKTKLPLLAVALLAARALTSATPLAAPAAVHTKPDDTSPALTYLKAGTEPVAAPDTLGTTPAGWMAIELPGPFDGYVQNKDLTKSLDVTPGAPIHLGPKVDSGVLTLSEKGDKTVVTGILGKWTQIRLERKLIAYVNIGVAPGYLPPIATAPAGQTAAPSRNDNAFSAAPVAPIAYATGDGGRPGQPVSLADNTAALPRQFVGKFVTTRSAFRPRRPFDWALNDSAGKRYAYLDTSKLLLTEQIEKYADHDVVVFGTARASTDGKDIVIVIDTLQLK